MTKRETLDTIETLIEQLANAEVVKYASVSSLPYVGSDELYTLRVTLFKNNYAYPFTLSDMVDTIVNMRITTIREGEAFRKKIQQQVEAYYNPSGIEEHDLVNCKLVSSNLNVLENMRYTRIGVLSKCRDKIRKQLYLTS